MKLSNVKRATVGQAVIADVSGTGTWLNGEITSFTKTHISFAPADGSDEVTMVRGEVFKSTADAVAELVNDKPVVAAPVAKVEDAEVVTLDDLDSDELEDEDDAERLIPTHRYTYQDVVAASGKKSRDNGDTIAKTLRGKDLQTVYAIAAEALEVTTDELLVKYGHLNTGHQRMCIGNRLRALKG